MAKDAILRTRQTLDNSQFKKGLKQSEGMAGQFKKSIMALGPAIGAAFGIGAVTNFIKSSMQAYDVKMRAEAKVRQAVKQTGQAAGFTAEELNKMASQLQKVTTYDGDEILNKVTAQLLSFPKITGQVFKDAQKAVLDVATLLDGDIQSSAIAIGKALQDPVKGITAMRRMGIMFTETQQEHIANLVEQGKLYEAQELILKEINTQYGGQAEAAAKVGLGALQQLKNTWGDFKEEMFAALTEGKTGGMFGWLKDSLEYMTWGLNKLREEGRGFKKWWNWFWQTGEFTSEEWEFAKNSEKNADQLKKNADILRGVSNDFKTYGEMVDASAEANNKAAPTIEKTAEELEKEAAAAKKATEESRKLHQEYRKLNEESMKKISGGFEPVDLPELAGANIFTEQQQQILEALQTVSDSRITGMQLEGGGLLPESMVERDVKLMSTWKSEYEKFSVDVQGISDAIQQTMQAMAMQVVDAFGSIIEGIVSGDMDFSQLGAGLLSSLGQLMQDLGKQILLMSGLMAAFQAALKSMQWQVAIPIGLALVAAGAALKGIAKKSMQPAEMALGGVVPGGFPGDTYPALLSSGETVLPRPIPLGAMSSGMEIVSIVRGEDIYQVMQKQTQKNNRYR